MTEMIVAFAVPAFVLGSAFLIAVLAFLPSKQVSLRPVRVRRERAPRSNR
ncbi:MAG: hypothetical protein NUV50_03275 [Rhodospirillales bacterium]|nr:hypothetical protein [Rhodospirillales bacterium]